MKRALLAVLTALTFSGCLTESVEELDRLVKEDAAFKQMIVARNETRRQIDTIKQELLARKKALDEQVGKMRSEYDLYSKAQNAKVEQFRTTIEANRDQLKRELELASASLERKISELAGYQKTLADVKKVLTEGKGLALSKSERQKWEERTLLLSEKMRPLAEEIQDLRLRIRLKRQKIGFLK